MSPKPAVNPVALWRMWPVVAVGLASAAGLLFAAGYNLAGAVAFVLCAGGYVARRRLMRR
ncbi:MAG: hypothetical protein J2P51_07030 [Hyphomicrobiaceae bacterium]|nr:hypothetical protein [Hyphomicrobiaceae bacterium]